MSACPENLQSLHSRITDFGDHFPADSWGHEYQALTSEIASDLELTSIINAQKSHFLTATEHTEHYWVSRHCWRILASRKLPKTITIIGALAKIGFDDADLDFPYISGKLGPISLRPLSQILKFGSSTQQFFAVFGVYWVIISSPSTLKNAEMLLVEKMRNHAENSDIVNTALLAIEQRVNIDEFSNLIDQVKSSTNTRGLGYIYDMFV